MRKSANYTDFVLKLMLIATILIIASAIIFSVNNNFINNIEKNDVKVDDSEKKLINKLYGYVTYGRDIQPMYYFFRNKEINYEDFDNKEKVAYAFQLANESNVTDLTERSFTVSGETYKVWIEEIFGKDTPFDNSNLITLHIDNGLLKNSIVEIKYDRDKDQYNVTKINGYIKEKEKIESFYSELFDYNIDNSDKTITIREKVIFVAKELSNDLKSITNIKVYKDLYQTKLIDEIKKPTKKQIENFKLNNYAEDANIITYTFKVDEEGNYYFYSSKIEE